MKTRSPKAPKAIKARVSREKNKDPYRKRSFDPDDVAAPLLQAWEDRNGQKIKFGWMVNRAIEEWVQKNP